jgi:hypothetical protein
MQRNLADDEDEGILTGNEESVKPRVGLDKVFEKYNKTNWLQVMQEVFDEVGESGDTSAAESETESGNER